MNELDVSHWAQEEADHLGETVYICPTCGERFWSPAAWDGTPAYDHCEHRGIHPDEA